MEEKQYREVYTAAEAYAKSMLKAFDGGHDWHHTMRVLNMAMHICRLEGRGDPQVVKMAALLHDIADTKFHEGNENDGGNMAYQFLSEQGFPMEKAEHVREIINNISFKKTFDRGEQKTGLREADQRETDDRENNLPETNHRKGVRQEQDDPRESDHLESDLKEPDDPRPGAQEGSAPFHPSIELQIVRDADRLDAMGAIGIARAFNYGGYKNRPLHDPEVPPAEYRSTREYQQSTAPTLNHFYEKLFLLKARMHTETGKTLAQERHDYMKEYVERFLDEWSGKR